MAGTPLGAPPAPLSLPTLPSALSTRSRRLHGAFLLDMQVARVWSSRRVGDARGVVVELGADTLLGLTGRFTVTQARMIARALTDAAAALELGTGRQGGAA